MNWFKKISSLIKTANEYWFMDGHAQFADGNIGDYNHEEYVVEYLREYLRESLDLPFDPHSAGARGWLDFACKNFDKVIQSIKKNHVWNDKDKELNALLKKRDCKIFSILFAEGLLDDQLLYDIYNVPDQIRDLINGYGDARLYGIKTLGWQRVQGNNVEIWELSKTAINSIVNGYDSVDGESEEDRLINIYTFKDKCFYENVPLSALGLLDVKSLQQYKTVDSGSKVAKNIKDFSKNSAK